MPQLEAPTLTRPTVSEARTVTLDVQGEHTIGLRKRLQQRELSMTSALAGGIVFEDGPNAFSYHLASPGAWVIENRSGAWVARHSAGHRLVLQDGGLDLAIAK